MPNGKKCELLFHCNQFLRKYLTQNGLLYDSRYLKQTLIVATLIPSLNKNLRKFVENEG